MLCSRYVSQEMLETIRTQASESSDFSGLLSILDNIERAFEAKNYREVHIELRNLGEYTRAVYDVVRLSDIPTSTLCDFLSDADVKNYFTLFSALEENGKKYIENFLKSSDEEQEKELELIGAQSAIASNFLHKTPDRLELVIDEFTLPPPYQVHLLIAICHKGILNKAKKNHCCTSHKWERGLSFDSDGLDKDKIYIDLLQAVLDGKNIDEELKKNESIALIYNILSGNIPLALKEVEKKIKSTTKKNNMNRHLQLKLLKCYLYYYNGEHEKAIHSSEKLYAETYKKYGYIAHQTLFLLRHEQLLCRDFKFKQKWADVLSSTEIIPRPDESKDDGVEGKIYAEINRKKTGSYSLGSHAEPILGESIICIVGKLVSDCSYGLIVNVSSYLSKLLQYFIVQLEINSLRKDTIIYLSYLLPIVLRLPNSENDVIKAASRIFCQYATRSSIENMFGYFKSIESLQYYELLIELIPVMTEKQLEKLHKEFWRRYKDEYVPRNFLYHTYKTKVFAICLHAVARSETLQTSARIEALLSNIEEVMTLYPFGDVYTPLEGIFQKKIKTANAKEKEWYRNLCQKMINSQDNNVYFWIFYAVSFGAPLYDFVDRLSIPEKIILYTNFAKNTFNEFDKLDIKEAFKEEVAKKLKKKSYSSSDKFSNDFAGFCFIVLNYYKKDKYAIEEIVDCILKVVDSSPMEEDFTGDRPDLFWKKIYLLLVSDIPKYAKQILFKGLLPYVGKIKNIKYRQFKYNTEITMYLKFYQIVLTSLLESKPLSNEAYFSLILNIEKAQLMAPIIPTYYALYNNSTTVQKEFLFSYLLNFISNPNQTPTAVYIMAQVLRGIVDKNPQLRSKIEPHLEDWSCKILSLFENAE